MPKINAFCSNAHIAGGGAWPEGCRGAATERTNGGLIMADKTYDHSEVIYLVLRNIEVGVLLIDGPA